ncbi:MAG: FkbM family methyltransferase [Bacteroidia bacterium]|nr:FkbM family methyltransferase [Bacteroidia bacterium]
MLQKINTYFWYFIEYTKHGDFRSVVASARYLISKKSHSKDRIIQTSVGKFFCRKNTNDFQFANFRYEWGVKRFFLDHVQEYSLFVDAGSCIGIYAILSAKYNLPCIALEPVAANFDVLMKNIELNQMTGKVRSFQLGLGNENKVVNFYFDRVNTGASRIDNNHISGNCRVELRTFDSLLPEFNINKQDNILFKLDVEGMEYEALQGAESFIRNHPRITLVLEKKFTGKTQIKSILDTYGEFEYGMVDQYNMYARKLS